MLALSLHVVSKSIAAGQRLVEFSDFASGVDGEVSELFDSYSLLRLTNVCTMVGAGTRQTAASGSSEVAVGKW